MRIPSQFNDSSLYRPGNRRDGGDSKRIRAAATGASAEWRRVFRLGVALLFVVVMMREAARPGVYQPFFGTSAVGEGDQWRAVQSASALAAEGTVGKSNGAEPESVVAMVSTGRAQPSQESELGWDASAWVAAMDVEQQREWASAIVRWWRQDASEAKSGSQVNDASANASAQGLERLSTQTIASGINLLDELDRDGDAKVRESLDGLPPDEDPKWESIRWWAEPTLWELDAAALSRVEDGTFWTGGDSDALYLQLACAEDLTTSGAETVGTLPLLSEPRVYQGKRIRLVGQVGLCERKEAKENSYGIAEYWRTWMVPRDGGVRPIALITLEMPDELATHLKNGEWNAETAVSNPDGEFVAVGRFLKRLPYRSSVGSDLAPVVVGRIVATRDTALRLTKKRDAASESSGAASVGLSWRTAGLFAAVVFGVSIAAVLTLRASADAKRTRDLRQRTWATTEIRIEGHDEESS